MRNIKGILKGEEGWFIMDAIALCFIIGAMAGVLGLYRTGIYMRQSAMMRSEAIHLAETQCSYLEEQAYNGELPEGETGWRGRPDDLNHGVVPMTVRTDIVSFEPPMKQIIITVSWTLRGKEESFQLERRILEHG